MADVNGDGRPDLVYAYLHNYGTAAQPSYGGRVSILLANGNGTFGGFEHSTTISLGPMSVAPHLTIADVNGDRNPDLVVTIPGPTPTSPGEVEVFLGNGNGASQSPQTTALPIFYGAPSSPT